MIIIKHIKIYIRRLRNRIKRNRNKQNNKNIRTFVKIGCFNCVIKENCSDLKNEPSIRGCSNHLYN
jgi:hypothetical protein